MRRKQVFHDRAIEQSFHFANIVQSEDLLFFSGFLSQDANGEIRDPGDWERQIANVYADLGRALARFGAGFSDVLKETLYCVDMDAMAGFAHVRSRAVSGATPFAATWVQVSRLIHPDALLEVEIVARLPSAA